MVSKCLSMTVVWALIGFSLTVAGVLPTESIAADSGGTFTGTWVANGSKEVLPFGEKRETALFKLSGHVNLHEEIVGQKDYWADCIGLADSALGSNVRCVWHALNGQKIYIILESKRLAEGASVSGTIVGGTGMVAGIKGSLNFVWKTMTFQRQNNSTEVGGYATDLNGSFQLP